MTKPSTRKIWGTLLLLLVTSAAVVGFLKLRREPSGPGRRPLIVIGIDGGEWRGIRKLWEPGKLPNPRRTPARGAAPSGPGRRPWIVIGIDGGEWRVIRKLWDQGKLPNLRRIAERGVSTTLHTAYNSSPVIWTTIATGVTPPEHGITDFVVPTPQGDVPISSEVRKVPALWNMLTKVGRRVAVLGWWGSWPAEEVNGVVVTDRALLDLDARVSPPSYLPRFEEAIGEARRDPGLFRIDEEADLRDAAIARAATRLAGEDYDLLLVYFRSPDIVSHGYWKYFEPEAVRKGGPPGMG